MSKFSISKKKEYKLSEDAALEIIKDACYRYDIDIDANEDRKAQKNMEALLNSLLDFVRRGLIELKDDGSIIQHFVDAPGETLEVNYKRITGQQKLAMDGKDENDQYAKMYAVLGASSGLGESAIKKLHGLDLKVAESLTIFFL